MFKVKIKAKYFYNMYFDSSKIILNDPVVNQQVFINRMTLAVPIHCFEIGTCTCCTQIK